MSDERRDHAEALVRPGFFKLQLVKGGPWIPAVIYRPCPLEMLETEVWQGIDRYAPLRAAMDSDSFGALKDEVDPYRVWVGGREIELWEFQHWMNVRRHIRLHEPDAFDADRMRKVDLSKAPPRRPRPR